MNKKFQKLKTVQSLMNLITVLSISLIFILIWWNDYNNVGLVHFFFRGYYVIFLIYLIITYLFTRLYGGDRIGTSSISELIFSETLALFFINLITYLQFSLIAYRMLPIWPFFRIMLFQIAGFAVVIFIEKKIYLKTCSPMKTALLYCNNKHHVTSKLARKHNPNFNFVKECSVNDKFNPSTELNGIECVFITDLAIAERNRILHYCYQNYIPVYMVPGFYDVLLSSSQYISLIDTPVYQVNHFGPSQFENGVKRFFDILLSLIGIVISSPFWLITVIAIKLNDGGPVFYKQERLTQYGRSFHIIKFRSMKVNAEKKTGAVLAAENDDRITSVGKVIRRFRIDELPQLLNILKGDMSIVGPRPERPEIAQKILETCPDFMERLKMKAGLTGYAQVYGKYNTTLDDKLLLDLNYIENFSLSLDARIILMTLKILFMKESTEGVH